MSKGPGSPYAPVAEVAATSELLLRELRVSAEISAATVDVCAGPCAGDAPCEVCAEMIWAGGEG